MFSSLLLLFICHYPEMTCVLLIVFYLTWIHNETLLILYKPRLPDFEYFYFISNNEYIPCFSRCFPCRSWNVNYCFTNYYNIKCQPVFWNARHVCGYVADTWLNYNAILHVRYQKYIQPCFSIFFSNSRGGCITITIKT